MAEQLKWPYSEQICYNPASIDHFNHIYDNVLYRTMPRFLHRHKSAEFLRSLRVIDDTTNPPKSHSVRLSKQKKTGSSGHLRKGVRSLLERLESPRSPTFRRHRFQKTLNGDDDALEEDLEEREDDEDDDLTTRPSESSPIPFSGNESESSKPEDNVLPWPFNARGSSYVGRDVIVKARAESPHLLQLPRRSGSLNKARLSLDRNSNTDVAACSNNLNPLQRVRAVDADLDVGQHGSCNTRGRELESCIGETLFRTVSPSASLVSSTRPLLCIDNAESAGASSGNQSSFTHSLAKSKPAISADIDNQDLGEAIERAFSLAGGGDHAIERQSTAQTNSESAPPSHSLADLKASIAWSWESDDSLETPERSDYILKIPRGKKWRNAHKNYFPTGGRELPQELVIRFCNESRRDLVEKKQNTIGLSTVVHR